MKKLTAKQKRNASNEVTMVSGSENKIEFEKLAKDIAVLFEKKIPAHNLAKWLSVATTNLDPSNDLLQELGQGILPGLISAKTQSERVTFLAQNLTSVFGTYQSLNESLFQLGENFFKGLKGRAYAFKEIEDFTSVYLPLLAVCEMFERYEYLKETFSKAA